MAVIAFEVSDDLARQIRGLVDSGRPADITFCVRARTVVEVRTENIWANDTARRSFDPGDTSLLTRARARM